MSERSEFGLRAASGEERREPARLYRVGSRPAKGVFGSLFGPSKRNSHAQRAKALYLLKLFRSSLCDFDIKERINRGSEDQRQGFRAVARLTFVLAKISKTAVAGRDPPRYSRGGPLRFSDDGGTLGP